jgi:hypothetical protein
LHLLLLLLLCGNGDWPGGWSGWAIQGCARNEAHRLA